MSLLGAALAATVLFQDPAPATTLAERMAAEHARNAALPPFVPTALPRVTSSVPPKKVEPSDCCIKSLKSLLAAPSIEDPTYPTLLMSLVAYHDERRKHVLVLSAEVDADLADTAPEKHQRIAQLHAKRATFQVQVREASEKMVNLLKVLVSTPQRHFARHLEEALYLYVQELQALGREVEAKDAAIRLIQGHRDGRYAARAYTMFGLYYLGKGKLTDARNLFERVLARATRDADADAISHLGLGWSYLRSEAGELPRPDLALAAFIRTIESAPHNSILRSAHDGLVHAFAAAGRPDHAFPLFTRLAALPQPLLGRLALAYFARGQHRESAVIYRDLIRLHPSDPQACTWQTRLLLTAVAAHDRTAEQHEALRLATTWKTWRDEQRHSKTIRRQCRDDTRDILIDLTNQRPPDDPARTALCTAHRDLFPDDPPLCAAP